MTPTPVLLVCAFGLAIWALLRLRHLNEWERLGLASIVVGFVLWLAPVKLGTFVPWLDTYYQIPGGSGLRAITRIELIAGCSMLFGVALLLAMLWSNRQWREISRAPLAIVVTGALILVVIEQLNTSNTQVVSVDYVRNLGALPTPPSECRSFVLLSAEADSDTGPDAGSEATYVAQATGLPTWNGYSGTIPTGWSLANVKGMNYRNSVKSWGEQHNLLATGCGLDLRKKTWLNPQQLAAYLSG